MYEEEWLEDWLEMANVITGKLAKTDGGAIWTISKDEFKKINSKEDCGSSEPFWTDSGYRFGLGLGRLEGGEDGWVHLVNVGKVKMKLEATVTIQQEMEVDVKASGFFCAEINVPNLFSDTSRALVVEVRLRSCEEDQAAAFVVKQSSWKRVMAPQW